MIPHAKTSRQVTLDFALEEDFATVTATCLYAPKEGKGGSPLVLDGRESFVELLSVSIDGKVLSAEDYALTPNAEDTKMTIGSKSLGASSGTTPFTVTVTTRFKPQNNLELSGLYKSSGTFCTQCEAEGFRLITYFPDRPDVMSTYEVRMTADEETYPVLLSNGNLKEQFSFEAEDESIDGEKKTKRRKHTATWIDPHRKPCYLFALVAGDLSVVEDSFRTMSGRDVTLRIYAEKKNIDRCDFAMRSLRKAMRWDETRFGLEYDLDLFNIVAVDDFNMGAMENKSLNIFNSRLVLATPDSATDAAFGRIEGVIGHEYFHNWTGNRVTCRDWFQLSLKEGLTVFRDQEFSADVSSRAVKRIADVRFLRDAQFAEDQSPMSHPIRPASYMKIDNFYTLTVYEKGAEVIRVYHTLLGETGFRKGMDLYFERHDGCAVTCDDFFAAMRDANEDVDIEALHNWYHQAGTPSVRCERRFDAASKTFFLTLEQCLPKTPDEHGSDAKVAQLIPVTVGLLDAATGSDIDIRAPDRGGRVEIAVVDGSESGKVGRGSRVAFKESSNGSSGGNDPSTSVVLVLSAMKATFAFKTVGAPDGGSVDPFANGEPLPSLLRNFSAPVAMTVVPAFDTKESVFFFAHDSDPFNRWEAAQTMARGIICRAYKTAAASISETNTDADYDGAQCDFASIIVSDEAWPAFAGACASIVDDAANDKVDRAWAEEALSFPGVSALLREVAPANPVLVHRTRSAFVKAFAKHCVVPLKNALETCEKESHAAKDAGEAYDIDEKQTARRSLRAYCLAALASLDVESAKAVDFDAAGVLRDAYDGAQNMTETVSVLNALAKVDALNDDDANGVLRATFKRFLETWKDDANVSCTYLSSVAQLSAYVSDVVADDANETNPQIPIPRSPTFPRCARTRTTHSTACTTRRCRTSFTRSSGVSRGETFAGSTRWTGADTISLSRNFSRWTKSTPSPRPGSPSPSRSGACTTRDAPLMMRLCLEKILAAKPSPNMFEICTKSLAAE
jgi:aminopeptidase N